MPGVVAAIAPRSTSGASFVDRVWTRRIASRPDRSGGLTVTRRSKRPGRFDRRVVVDRPDLRGREQILKVHTRQTPLTENVDLSVIARGTPGFSGADLANLVNEAALNAARFNKKKVEMIDFEYAKDKVMMGPERKSMIMTEEEKKNTAYHEGGHALVAALLPDADPVHKVTIIPRGRALGLTMQLPSEDKYSHTK